MPQRSGAVPLSISRNQTGRIFSARVVVPKAWPIQVSSLLQPELHVSFQTAEGDKGLHGAS